MMSRTMRVSGSGSVKGTLKIPGDKSISHRAAMLASVAGGTSRIKGFASSKDCHATLDCIERLGIKVSRDDHDLTIEGEGLYGYKPSDDRVALDVGNSGSTIRMLSGLLAAQPFISEIDGDESIRRRPMARIIEPLAMMGARIHAREERFAPLRIQGASLKAINYAGKIASAQVKTCVLLAGLFADGLTTVREPSRSRDHSELMLREFGARFSRNADERGEVLAIEGGNHLRPVEYEVPGDISSAAFFIAASTLLPDSELVLKGVGLNPTRIAFIEVLDALGANIARENVAERHGELVGDLRVTSRGLRSERGGLVLAGDIIPNIIDEIPILAVIATQAGGRIEVRDAKELRIKESDRIRTVVDAVRALEGEIEEFEDGFAITGPQRLKGGRVDSAGDHRIAMAFSIAGLIADGTTEILGAESVDVSLPEFYDMLASVTDQ